VNIRQESLEMAKRLSSSFYGAVCFGLVAFNDEGESYINKPSLFLDELSPYDFLPINGIPSFTSDDEVARECSVVSDILRNPQVNVALHIHSPYVGAIVSSMESDVDQIDYVDSSGMAKKIPLIEPTQSYQNFGGHNVVFERNHGLYSWAETYYQAFSCLTEITEYFKMMTINFI
jgi:ribulose-5-phosphate 4-epimerase/fuculose-1-phosphate aldolase